MSKKIAWSLYSFFFFFHRQFRGSLRVENRWPLNIKISARALESGARVSWLSTLADGPRQTETVTAGYLFKQSIGNGRIDRERIDCRGVIKPRVFQSISLRKLELSGKESSRASVPSVFRPRKAGSFEDGGKWRGYCSVMTPWNKLQSRSAVKHTLPRTFTVGLYKLRLTRKIVPWYCFARVWNCLNAVAYETVRVYLPSASCSKAALTNSNWKKREAGK